MPMQMPMQPPPAMPIGGVPPGAPPPGAMPGGTPPNPLAMMAKAPGAGGGAAQQLMTFMAGMGAMDFVKFLNDLKGGGKAGKSTAQKEATGNPAQTQISPQLLAQLAARRQAAMGGGAPPGGMQGNPLAAIMPR